MKKRKRDQRSGPPLSGNRVKRGSRRNRYQMQPLAGDMASGEEVANHLEELFGKHGAPLFIKRDNGGNLNHQAVNEVLAKWMVIPINSPIRCPQYNGAIENAQKDWDRFLDPRDPFVTDNLQTCSRIAAHDLNHTPRQVLKNRIPCAVFHGPDKLKPNKRYRKNAYEWITNKALDLTGQDDKSPACAWRTAVLTWLLMNHHINITYPKCVTRFSNQNRS